MFNLLPLLPHVMTIGEDIYKCIEGDCTQAEWDKTVDDFYNAAKSVPEIQGMMAIMFFISNVAKVSFPLVDSFINGAKPEDTTKLKSLRKDVAKAVTSDDDLAKAERTLKLLNEVSAKLAADSKKIKAPKKKVVETNWTERFFETQNN